MNYKDITNKNVAGLNGIIHKLSKNISGQIWIYYTAVERLRDGLWVKLDISVKERKIK